MDVNTLIGVTGFTLAVLSGAFAYFNRERYKTLINDIYQPGNEELRQQLATCKAKVSELEKEVAAKTAKYQEQEKYIARLEGLILRLPKWTELTQLISSNHTEVMNMFAHIGGKKDVK